MKDWVRPQDPVYLQLDALEWSLEHALGWGSAVFLPPAFEYKAIQHDWDRVSGWLSGQDMREWAPRASRRFLAPKRATSFRYVTQLDPLEDLAFTALLRSVGPMLEKRRIPKAKEITFSWRFQVGPGGQMFDPGCTWSGFNQQCRSLASRAEFSHVVMADVADFFPHIYHHPLEQVVAAATGRSAEAYCILRMMKSWNAMASFGVPVGVAGARILAEATIVDIDEMLLGAGYTHCRYADDFRVFCGDPFVAREALEELAQCLFEKHGLTLQPEKTQVITTDEYLERFDVSPDRAEVQRRTDRLRELLREAGVEDDYDGFDWDDLPSEVKGQIDKLNLDALLRDQLARVSPDPLIVSGILVRLGQLGQDELAEEVLDAIEKLEPVIPAVVRYITALRKSGVLRCREIGERLLEAVISKPLGEYATCCLLSVFTHGNEFGHEDRFESLHKKMRHSSAVQRELALALGRAAREDWFLHRRRDYRSLGPWNARAFLAGMQCVNWDARDPFYRSLRGGQDPLERAIISWSSR